MGPNCACRKENNNKEEIMVAVQLYFKNFDRSQHLEQYIHDHMVRFVEPFLRNGSGNFLKIIISEDSRKRAAKPHIVCESILKLQESSRPIVTRKASYNFYESINKAAGALKKVLTKKKERLRNHKHEAPKIEIEV